MKKRQNDQPSLWLRIMQKYRKKRYKFVSVLLLTPLIETLCTLSRRKYLCPH